MNLEDLKDQWTDFDKKLDKSIKLNSALLRQSVLHKTSSALQGLSRSIVIELLMNFVAIISLSMFMANHISEIEFLAPAMVLDLCAIFLVAFGIYQLVALGSIDYSNPIIIIQKKLETLRIKRIRTTKWTLLLSPLLWTPLMMVALKGVFEVNAYIVLGAYWLASNLLVGVVVILIMVWVSKRYANRLQGSPFVQRFINDLAGRNLSAAKAFLDTLSRFEQEEQ